MTREQEWAVFDKAVELTASAVRGAVGGQDSRPAAFVAEVFREVYTALRETAPDGVPERDLVVVARAAIRGARTPDLVVELRDLLEREGGRR